MSNFHDICDVFWAVWSHKMLTSAFSQMPVYMRGNSFYIYIYMYYGTGLLTWIPAFASWCFEAHSPIFVFVPCLHRFTPEAENYSSASVCSDV